MMEYTEIEKTYIRGLEDICMKLDFNIGIKLEGYPKWEEFTLDHDSIINFLDTVQNDKDLIGKTGNDLRDYAEYIRGAYLAHSEIITDKIPKNPDIMMCIATCTSWEAVGEKLKEKDLSEYINVVLKNSGQVLKNCLLRTENPNIRRSLLFGITHYHFIYHHRKTNPQDHSKVIMKWNSHVEWREKYFNQ